MADPIKKTNWKTRGKIAAIGAVIIMGTIWIFTGNSKTPSSVPPPSSGVPVGGGRSLTQTGRRCEPHASRAGETSKIVVWEPNWPDDQWSEVFDRGDYELEWKIIGDRVEGVLVLDVDHPDKEPIKVDRNQHLLDDNVHRYRFQIIGSKPVNPVYFRYTLS